VLSAPSAAIIPAVRISRFICGVCLMVLTAQGAFSQGVKGRVTSTSGEPLAGVTVWNYPSDKASTDADGVFLIKPGLLRFQVSGYRPLFRLVQEGSNISVVMEQSADALWTPPVCKLAPDWFRGEQMAFRRPKHAHIKRGFDVDYGNVLVRYKKNALLLGYGGTWSWGHPPEQFFMDIAELHERDILYKPDWPTAEYRGRRSDGSYFRFIGMFMETIDYDHATKEQADYFDAIMDTLCWVRDPYRK
jgi:hypothetical protein